MLRLYRSQYHTHLVRAYPELDERVPVLGAISGIGLQIGLGGKPCEVSITRHRDDNGRLTEPAKYMGQFWKDGFMYSFPVRTIEAGINGKNFTTDRFYTFVYEPGLTDCQWASIRTTGEKEWLNSIGTTCRGILRSSTTSIETMMGRMMMSRNELPRISNDISSGQTRGQ